MYGGSSYGSSYGGGMSSYGGMGSYGGYGSSYGMGSGYGSTYGSSYGSSYGMNNNLRNQQQNGRNGTTPEQENPEINQRRKVFEQFFKMMGGMRSILELGFAGVAFANFGSQTWKLFKKIFTFLFQTSTKFSEMIAKFIPTDTLKSVMAVALKGEKTGVIDKRTLIMVLLRVLAIAFVVVGYRLKNQIHQQIDKQDKELQEKMKEIEKKKCDIQTNLNKYKNESNL